MSKNKTSRYKFNNRRVELRHGESSEGYGIFLRFKRLIKHEEIEEFKAFPTVRMSFKKNIVISELCLSEEAAFALMLLLQKKFVNNK